MKSHEIRKKFLKYFEQKDHLILPSASLIPHDDPTLLFTNAGMNQFKSVFLGTEKPKKNRAVTVQKCVRAGGKHNDLDNVGFTARHHTFFEMMGNFSFGDYFKEDAIAYSWDFITKELGLDKKRLYVTAFNDDKEAEEIWKKKIGIPADHFFTYGEKDNFWRMGDVGPCGPCSEIFYDLGPEMGDGPENVVGGEGDRYVEIWNLVFMQYEESPDGMTPLPNPSVDTGMGLERISMALQGTKSNYETDLFMPLLGEAAKLTKTAYLPMDSTKSFETAALRVLADHTRAISFLMADGILPSNEGRGYVLRRILRRAVRFNRKLSPDPIMTNLSKELIHQMMPYYPELEERKDIILDNVKREENKFLETLDKGEDILFKELDKLSSKGIKTVPGDLVFKLYDTFGFPADLTEIIAKEKGFETDNAGFESSLTGAKEMARGARNVSLKFNYPQSLKDSVKTLLPTQFVGYDQIEAKSRVLELHNEKGKTPSVSEGQFFLVTEQTPFYAEGGGQVGDQGTALTDSAKIEVLDCKKLDSLFVHSCEIKEGSVNAGDEIKLKVDRTTRMLSQRNHSATHLMHAALRKVLGDSVQQAGSLVNAERLRFDFSFQGPVPKNKLDRIEKLVNEEILLSQPTRAEVMDFEEAKSAGALALFGEKYSEKVRVLTMGEFSKELCGGTHVANTSEIGLFKIINETGVSSGVRRIEAVTSMNALNYLDRKTQDYEESLQELGLPKNATKEQFQKQIGKFKEEIKTLQLKLKSQNQVSPKEIAESAFEVNSIKVCFAQLDQIPRNDLRDLSDKVRDHLKEGIVVLTGEHTDKGFPIIVAKTKDVEKSCGNLLKSLCEKLGGKGGGRPDFAQGNLNSTDGLRESLQELV